MKPDKALFRVIPQYLPLLLRYYAKCVFYFSLSLSLCFWESHHPHREWFKVISLVMIPETALTEGWNKRKLSFRKSELLVPSRTKKKQDFVDWP